MSLSSSPGMPALGPLIGRAPWSPSEDVPKCRRLFSMNDGQVQAAYDGSTEVPRWTRSPKRPGLPVLGLAEWSLRRAVAMGTRAPQCHWRPGCLVAAAMCMEPPCLEVAVFPRIPPTSGPDRRLATRCMAAVGGADVVVLTQERHTPRRPPPLPDTGAVPTRPWHRYMNSKTSPRSGASGHITV